MCAKQTLDWSHASLILKLVLTPPFTPAPRWHDAATVWFEIAALLPGHSMRFEYLVDHPDKVPQVIAWWHTIWADRMGDDIEALQQQLLASLQKEQLPIHILAVKNGEPVGTAALKLQELAEMFPDRQFWLGSVFVDGAHRGEQIATALTEQIIELAQARDFPHLYLQTVNLSGGLYARLGWLPVEHFQYRGVETLLMCRTL